MKKEKSKPIFDLEHGKLSPQATDIEELILGAILVDKNIMNIAIDILQPEVFYTEAHQKIYEATETIYNKNEPIDIMIVKEQLKSTGDLDLVGGIAYLVDLTNEFSTEYNIEKHCLIIKEKYFLRELIKLNTGILADAYEDTTDVFDLIGRYHLEMGLLLNSNFPTKEKGTAELFREFTERTKEAAKNRNEGTVIGVPSTLKDLNDITGGWQPSDLIIVAGRPGMGKTSFLKACTKKAIKELQKPILIFSLEMSSYQLTARMVSEEMNISAGSFLKGDIPGDFEEKTDKVNKEYFSKDGKELLIIDDTPALSISQIRHRAKKIKADNDISMIIVDYIQLCSEDKTIHSNNREQDISAISRGLKSLAKELNIPIIALSQLNREVERRGGNMKPKLSDLRESGAIEQDSDIVIFLYRPRYYYNLGVEKMKIVKVNGIEISSEGYAQIIIAKNRNGATGNVHVAFIDYLTKFEDWQEDQGTSNYYESTKTKDERTDDLPF